jgi:HEPN domain-containing protein
MDINDHIKYWIDSSDNDLEAARNLFTSGKYDWCLFIGHLVLEKTLKAAYVSNNKNKIPPKTHNLTKLANLSNLKLTEEQIFFLDEVNDFNLEVRYPEYKREFYKLCTKKFANKYFSQIQEVSKWIRSQII